MHACFSETVKFSIKNIHLLPLIVVIVWKKERFPSFFFFIMYCLHKFAYLYKGTNVVV